MQTELDETIDKELEAQANKTGDTDADTDVIEDDLSVSKDGSDSDNGDKKDDGPKVKKDDTPPVDPNAKYPLSTLLCGLHFSALKMASKKAGSLTLSDFEYPESLKPALEDALMKVAPAIMSNPYVIIGGILLIHTQNMMGIAKEREEEKLKSVME